MPPLLRLPGPVESPTTMRVGDDVFVRFTIPTKNADGHAPADIARVELYAVTSDRAPTVEDDPQGLRRVSKLIATEKVVNQGAVMVVHDTLTQDARAVVPLPRPKLRTRVADTERFIGPLVASLESSDPIRYYYAVGVSPRGRYGLVQTFMPVPLGATSSAPSAPALEYDATQLTIRWTPASDARGNLGPDIPDVLPAKPIVPGPPPTTYDVYEEPCGGSTNQTPPMPAALTPAPVGAAELKVPIGSFDIERCFFIRPVDIVNGYHVRGPASETRCITPRDTFPPAAPKSLSAVASASAVNLIWEPNEEADLAGYLVLRGEAPGATLTPLTQAPISETTYPDRSVTPGVTYVYAVVAVDKVGNRSPESNRVEETARQ